MSLEAGPYFQWGMSLGVRFGSIICSMVINMNEQKLNTVAQLRAFLEGTEAVRFDVLGEDDKRRLTRIEPRAQAVEEWTQHVLDGVEKLLFSKVNSWFMGVNPNIEGRQQRHFLLYAGGLPLYRKRCDEEAASGYRNFDLR